MSTLFSQNFLVLTTMYIYIYSIVFWDVGMPLLESKLLSLYIYIYNCISLFLFLLNVLSSVVYDSSFYGIYMCVYVYSIFILRMCGYSCSVTMGSLVVVL